MARDRTTGANQSIYRQRVRPRRVRPRGLPPEPQLEPSSHRDNTPAQNREIRAQVIAAQAVKAAAPALRASRRAAPGPAISGYAALSALLGPNVAARVPGTLTAEGKKPRSSATGTAVDVGLLLPFMRGPRAAIKGASALARGMRAADAGRVAKATLAEPAVRGTVRDVRRAYRARTLKAGELEQQLPKSRSRIARALVERPADATSRRLERSGAAKATPVVRLATASERVAKAAGRSQRIERARAEAGVAEHLNAIKRVKAGSREDVANFWYAQLPKSHRNGAGLRLIRGRQADELVYVTSGRALADLNRREQAVQATMRQLRSQGADASEVLPHLRELEELKVLKSDMPQRVDDISASIGQLDDLIAKPPPMNAPAIAAVHALSNERQRILVDAGRLNPERAAERKGLVARAVGLAPTGEEAYVGHRLPRPESFRGSTMPSGGVGRVRSPQGAGTENRLVLLKTGRARQSLRVPAEDWRSAQVFAQANQARDDLGRLGQPFTGHVPEGHVLVNPKGRTVPAHWKTDELAQFHDNYDDVEELRAKAREVVSGFVASTPDEVEAMKQAALASGVSWDELRVVPKRLVDRYYAQFRPSSGRGTPAKVYDSVVDAVATLIVFARAGYIPKNVVQNLVMALPHQGGLLLVNAVRAGQAMADPQLRQLLQAEVGFTGATGALGREAFSRQLLGKAAGAVGKIADDPIRISAFMHEAAAEGVISRVNPLLTEKDRAALLRLLTDRAERPRLNDIRSRTVEAMADFSRLTPDQARLARRILIIPGWLMAGSRYPFHFAATHPVRSALLAYVAMGEPGAPKRAQVNRPVNEYFTGTDYRRGINTPAGRIRTGSLSPVSTPAELVEAAAGTIRGRQGPFDYATPTAFDYANPFASALIRALQGEGVARSAQRLAPNYTLARDLVAPHPRATYPDDASRLGRLRREVGVLPIEVADPGATAAPPTRHGDSIYGGSRRGSHSIYRGGGRSGSSSIYRP